MTTGGHHALHIDLRRCTHRSHRLRLIGRLSSCRRQTAHTGGRIRDSAWDGKTIPPDSVCSNFGGKDVSPALKVSNIPTGANAIIIQFNDRDYGPLSNNGGHGTIGYWVSGGGSATLPSVKGFSAEMPAGAFIEARSYGQGAYRSPGYLAPCSGGRGHAYEAVVKAVYKAKSPNEESRLLAETTLLLGRF
ncbi:hypothetical protein FHP89_03440 [Denitromonas ohlonensis]|uniref:Uncharacterized protein n=2 Tax=Denitromonas TaxID=139331 RepID=A0A557RPU0_9RHOO|nr:hypothetical protein FHP90_08520 [Denitromonas ohlonensis]TVO79250.1 hypothetical protein FHP89_03440 [Denitromonas ohlonensis]